MLRIFSNSPAWESDMAWALCDDLNAEVALADLSQRLKNRQSVLAMVLQGVLFRKGGNARKALKIHESLLSRPDLPRSLKKTVYLQCALDHFALQEFEQAARFIDQLGFLWKRSVTVKYLRARVEAAGGHLNAARGLYESLRKQFPDVAGIKTEHLQILLRSAVENRQWGKTAAAAKIVHKVLAVDPVHPEGLLLLIDLCIDQNDLERAQFCLLQYLQTYGEYSKNFQDRLKQLKERKGDLNATLEAAL